MSDAVVVRLLKFKFRAKQNSHFRGWATVALPYGIILPDCPVYTCGRQVTASSPIRHVRGDDGEFTRERAVINFATPEDHAAFSNAVGAAVLAAHPDILTQPYD